MNLYMPYTNYHILLSLAIAMSYRDIKHKLILVNPMFKRLCNIFCLNNISISPLGYDDRRSNLHTFNIKKHNLRILAQEIKNIDHIDSCFYCCEWHVYTTYLAYIIRKASPATHFCLIEDGVSTYAEPERKKKNLLERIGTYVIYGPWHRDFYLPGSMAPGCDVYALFPDLLGTNFVDNVKHKINLNILLDNVNESTLSVVGNGRYRDYNSNVEALIAPDRSSRYTNGEHYRKTMAQLVYDTAHRFNLVAVKRHPADDKSVNFIPSGVNNVFELDANLPIEFYYLKFGKTLKQVIGSLSTSLLTAHCMLPEIQILSIISKEDMQSERQASMIIELFKKLNIEIKTI